MMLQGLLLALVVTVRGQYTEETAVLWEAEYNANASIVYYDAVLGAWNYNTNITAYNQGEMIVESAKAAAFTNDEGAEASNWDWQNFQDALLKREFSKITDIGYASLPEEDYNQMSEVGAFMETIYSTARVCNKPGDTDPTACYPLDPDLSVIMATSTDWQELLWAWQGFRNETGRKMGVAEEHEYGHAYEAFAGYLNQAADINGYEDNGDYWRSWYEDPNFRLDCEVIWQQMKPLYAKLHAYIKLKLKERYPNEYFPSTGHIPAHIMGNMWAQDWNALSSLVMPYPEIPPLDVTDEMQNQGYTRQTLFDLSEDFFLSLGMYPMPPNFYDDSMIERPDDREVVCHASAWDFYDGQDFRIKQCTEVTQDWLITTHHEMGHIEYYLAYKDLAIPFRDGANPGFHEAIGDTISLSVNTPAHLKSIGLLPDVDITDTRVDLNFLMSQALAKIAFIPFGYLIDQWRWDVFAGTYTRNDYNQGWWNARCKYQGVSPPVTRSNIVDFDPGAKYHVPANTPYIRYFVSHILQFQFHEALCNAAGYVGDLHNCDIYDSLAAGDLLKNMMTQGSSTDWHLQLEELTGSYNMDADSILAYFHPLETWLDEQLVGVQDTFWSEECPMV